MAALQLRRALKQQLGEVAYRRLKPAHIQTLLNHQIRTADDLRGAARWGSLESVKLPPGILKLLLEHFGAATTRRYVVEYQSAQKVLSLPNDVTLQDFKHALERKYALFKHVDYEVQLLGGEGVPIRHYGLALNLQESWAHHMDALPASSNVYLRISPLGKPYVEYIGTKLVDLPQLAQDHLGIADYERAYYYPAIFQGMDISSTVPFDGMILDQLVEHTALTLKKVTTTMWNTLEMEEVRDLVAPMLVDAVLISQKLGPQGNELHLMPQYEVLGRRAWGALDYALLYKIPAIIATQTKLVNPGQAWGQVLMQLASTRELLVRRLYGSDSRARKHWEVPELANIPTCGVLCNGKSYWLWRYLPCPGSSSPKQAQSGLFLPRQTASLEISKEFTLTLNNLCSEDYFTQLKADLTKLLKALVQLIVDQMNAIDAAQDKLTPIGGQYCDHTSGGGNAEQSEVGAQLCCKPHMSRTAAKRRLVQEEAGQALNKLK